MTVTCISTSYQEVLEYCHLPKTHGSPAILGTMLQAAEPEHCTACVLCKTNHATAVVITGMLNHFKQLCFRLSSSKLT